MIIRNLTAVRFVQEAATILREQALNGELQAALEEARLSQIGPLEATRTGFVAPLGGNNKALFYASGAHLWLTLGVHSRVLPPAVVDSELLKRLDAFKRKHDRPAGRRMTRRLKEEVVSELLPKSHVQTTRLSAFLDLDGKLLCVDTSSCKQAEMFASELRRALGSFPALALACETPPRGVMTGWLNGGAIPEGLVLGEECELRDADSQGAVVRCQRQDLHAEEIARLLEAGKQVTQLALCLNDRVSFVLGEDLTLRKIKVLDGAFEQLEELQDHDDLQTALFVAMAKEVRSVLDTLDAPLGMGVTA